MAKLDLQQKLDQAEAQLKARGVENLMLHESLDNVESERDALQQQVNALVAENLALLDFDWVSFNEDGPYGSGEVEALLPDVRATDAIKRQWMAEGVEQFAAFWESRCRHNDTFVGGEASNYATQLRQPEEKGRE